MGSWRVQRSCFQSVRNHASLAGATSYLFHYLKKCKPFLQHLHLQVTFMCCRWDWHAWQLFVSLLPPFGKLPQAFYTPSICWTEPSTGKTAVSPKCCWLNYLWTASAAQVSTAWHCMPREKCSEWRKKNRLRLADRLTLCTLSFPFAQSCFISRLRSPK